MEKDLFELMTKMYGEMQGGFEKVNAEFANVNNRLDSLEYEIKDVKSEVKKTSMVIENDIKPRLEALFDGYKQNSESITRIENDIKDLRLSINELHIKTIKNESTIISFSKRMYEFDGYKH